MFLMLPGKVGPVRKILTLVKKILEKETTCIAVGAENQDVKASIYI